MIVGQSVGHDLCFRVARSPGLPGIVMESKIGVVIQRILFGIIAIAFLLCLFVGDHLVAQWATERSGSGMELLRRGSIIPLLFVIVLGLGTAEMIRLLRAGGIRPFVIPAYVLTLGLVVLPWLGPAGFLGDSIADTEGLYWSVWGVMAAALLVGFCCVFRNNPTGTLRDGSATLLLVLYLGFLGSFGLQLRCILCAPTQDHHQGVWLLLITVLVIKSSDIGAYLVGSAIGRHKLIPKVSPGKSVEGAIGGLVGSGLTALLFAWPGRLTVEANQEPSRALWIWNEMTYSFGHVFPGEGIVFVLKAFFFGVILSFFAQMGDLFESCFKRDAGIKDSGAVMPHYGGILDLVDSPLFALPVAWFLLTRVWNIP
jgi:phosphatidate cytidylyltransferase